MTCDGRVFRTYFIRISFITLKTIFCFACIFIGRPVALYFNPLIFNNLMFQRGVNISDYWAKNHAECAHSFYVPTETRLIPIWIFCPPTSKVNTSKELLAEMALPEAKILFTVHGNTKNRAHAKQVDFYRKMAKAGWFVMSFDWRGFGENVGTAIARVAVEDTKWAFRWLRSKVPPNKTIIFHSHSLGSTFGTRSVYDLIQEGVHIGGLVVDSGLGSLRFNLLDSLAYKILFTVPWISEKIDSEIIKVYGFDNDPIDYMRKIDIPIMHLHAEDDKHLDIQQFYDTKKEMLKTKSNDSYIPIAFKGCRRLEHYIQLFAEEFVPLMEAFLDHVNRTQN